VLLIIRQLKKGGYNPVYKRVEDSASMKKALQEKQWDIILCDYTMPNFNGPSAIASLNETNLDIPLIIVSGTSGEDVVTKCMRLGARDYVKKNNLIRLCPAIERELEAAEIRNKCKWLKNNLRQTVDNFQNVLKSTIQFMISAIEARDPYKNGHQMRSANLACAIAAEMGLDQETTDGIRIASSIHDIGNLTIPAEILAKPAKLTNLEFSLVKEHSRNGYEMLRNVEYLWPLAQMVYQHHERMDGSGYPENLKGEEILMEARIIAISDVVESMVSDRSYRRAPGIEAALLEIQENKGILYDVAVADACLRLFREKEYQLF
jgi:putative two-component system response regulator